LSVISLVIFFFGGVTVFLYFKVSRGSAASWNGEGSRWLRRCYGTDRSAHICLNHSDRHVLCAVVLTHCYTVHFCVRSRVYRAVKSVYDRKISPTASLMFLEQVVHRVTTTWTTGRRVGVLFIALLKHRGIRFSRQQSGSFNPVALPDNLEGTRENREHSNTKNQSPDRDLNHVLSKCNANVGQCPGFTWIRRWWVVMLERYISVLWIHCPYPLTSPVQRSVCVCTYIIYTSCENQTWITVYTVCS
jgi:hypothetical protein